MAVEESEAQMKNAINQKLIELGEKERLKSLLKERLADCGWQQQMKDQCRKTVKERGADITVDDLVTEITPRGRALVPDDVKKELLQKIKQFLADQANL